MNRPTREMSEIGTVHLQTLHAGHKPKLSVMDMGLYLMTQPSIALGTGELLRETNLCIFIKIHFLRGGFVVSPQSGALGRPAQALNTTAVTPKED